MLLLHDFLQRLLLDRLQPLLDAAQVLLHHEQSDFMQRNIQLLPFDVGDHEVKLVEILHRVLELHLALLHGAHLQGADRREVGLAPLLVLAPQVGKGDLVGVALAELDHALDLGDLVVEVV